MFGISFEHVLVLGIILLFVGPRRLPQLGHTLGKAIKNFKDGVNGVQDATYRTVDETRKSIARAPEAPTATAPADSATDSTEKPKDPTGSST